jgi:hypothetical protein
MSSVVQTGVKAHDDTCANSLRTLQASVAGAGGSQSTINTAYILHYRNVVKSAIANGCGVEPAMTALRSLGVTGQ